jgi:hypothetical protein
LIYPAFLWVMPARSLQVTFYVTAREQRASVRLSAQTLNSAFLSDSLHRSHCTGLTVERVNSDPIIVEVTCIGRDGRRRYSRQAKRRLVEAYLQTTFRRQLRRRAGDNERDGVVVRGREPQRLSDRALPNIHGFISSG